MSPKKNFRLLTADEIECRVNICYPKDKPTRVSLLLYKDARVDMRMLDEHYGINNWQKDYQLIGNELFCTVSIWDEDKKQWIKKMDVGTESNTEATKGRASDAFKRACFNLGIGRELYTAPDIWVNLQGNESKYTKFYVGGIEYDSKGNIGRVIIVDKMGAVRMDEWTPAYRIEKNKVAEADAKRQAEVLLAEAKAEISACNDVDMLGNIYRKYERSLNGSSELVLMCKERKTELLQATA